VFDARRRLVASVEGLRRSEARRRSLPLDPDQSEAVRTHVWCVEDVLLVLVGVGLHGVNRSAAGVATARLSGLSLTGQRLVTIWTVGTKP